MLAFLLIAARHLLRVLQSRVQGRARRRVRPGAGRSVPRAERLGRVAALRRPLRIDRRVRHRQPAARGRGRARRRRLGVAVPAAGLRRRAARRRSSRRRVYNPLAASLLVGLPNQLTAEVVQRPDKHRCPAATATDRSGRASRRTAAKSIIGSVAVLRRRAGPRRGHRLRLRPRRPLPRAGRRRPRPISSPASGGSRTRPSPPPVRTPRTCRRLRLPTNLTPNEVKQTFLQLDSVSFWHFRELAASARRAGVPSDRYELQYQRAPLAPDSPFGNGTYRRQRVPPILPFQGPRTHDYFWRGRGLHALCCDENCLGFGEWRHRAATACGVATRDRGHARRDHGAVAPGGRMRGALPRHVSPAAVRPRDHRRRGRLACARLSPGCRRPPWPPDVRHAGSAITFAGAAIGRPDEKMLVESDQLVYDYDNEIVSAVGNVKIYYARLHARGREGHLQPAQRPADRDRQRQAHRSLGRRVLLRATSTSPTISATASCSRCASTRRAAPISPPSARSARAARRTTFVNGVYTACEPCKDHPEKPPLWNVKAAKIVVDHKEQMVYFTRCAARVLRHADRVAALFRRRPIRR